MRGFGAVSDVLQGVGRSGVLGGARFESFLGEPPRGAQQGTLSSYLLLILLLETLLGLVREGVGRGCQELPADGPPLACEWQVHSHNTLARADEKEQLFKTYPDPKASV